MLNDIKFSWTQPQDIRHGWWLWIIFTLAIMALGSLPANLHTVLPAYVGASAAWQHGLAIYSGTYSGFLYLPHAAIFTIPISWLPDRVGEAVWRLFCMGFMGIALWELSKKIRSISGVSPFFWLVLLSFAPMASMLRNGQMTTPLLATMIMATLALMDRRWNQAVFWLCLGLALKPLMLVLLLLAVVLYPPLLWRMAIGFVIMGVVPFATQSPSYVISQYQSFWHEVTVSAYPMNHLDGFVDLFHLLAFLGWKLSVAWRLGLSLLAGLITLLICFAIRRKHQNWMAALLILSWATVYLMLFNPRVEHNTYGMLAPVMCLFAFIECFGQLRKTLSVIIVLASVLLALVTMLPDITYADMWLRQAIALGFTVYLLSWIMRKPVWQSAGKEKLPANSSATLAV